MPDIPITPPQTSAVEDTVASTATAAVDTAAAAAQQTTAAAASPPPQPVAEPAPAPAPKPVEAVTEAVSAPAPKPVETVTQAVSKPVEAVAEVAPAPVAKPVEAVAEVAAAPTQKVSSVTEVVDHVTAAPTVKAVTEQATATVSQATAPLPKPVHDAVASVTTGATTEATTKTLDSAVNGTVGTVTKVADPVVNGTVGTVTKAAEPIVNGTVTPVADPVVKGTVGTVTQATDHVLPAAGNVTGGAGLAAAQTVDTVTATTGAAVGSPHPITDTVAAVTSGTARVAESAVSGPLATSTASVTDALPGPLARGTAPLTDAIAGPVAETTHQAVASAAASGGPSIVDISHTAAPGTSTPGLANTLAATVPAHGPGLAGPPVPDPIVMAPDPTTATGASLLPHAASGAVPTPGGAVHSATVDTLAQVATDPRLLAITGVTALAGTAYVAARSAGCVAGGDASVILNNVRLIPCLVKSGVTSGGAALASFGSGVHQAAGSASTATRAGIEVLDERVSKVADTARENLADRVVDPFRQGFARATDGGGDANGSDMFFFGVGLVVGLLYAAVLSLWLLVARPRWSTRA